MSSASIIDLIVVFSSALVIGTVVRYALPGRIKHGLLLVPAFAIVLAVLLWEVSLWAGLPSEWRLVAWISLLVITIAATIIFDVWLSRRRTREDDIALTAALDGLRTL